MVETISNLSYYQAMNQPTAKTFAQRHWLSLVQSLDLRARPQSTQLRPGQSAEEAWSTTGAYLREALHSYGKQQSRAHTGRRTS